MKFKLSKYSFGRTLIKPKRLLYLLAILIIILTGIFSYERLIENGASEAVKKKAVTVITETVNSALDDYLSIDGSFSDKCITEVKNQNGQILSYSVKSEVIAKAERQIINTISDSLREAEVFELSIPFGTLTKIKYFSGRGLPVKIKVYSVSAVTSDVETTIESVGINQSLYKIILKVNISCDLIFQDCKETINVPCSRILAEKIIIGGVPLA